MIKVHATEIYMSNGHERFDVPHKTLIPSDKIQLVRDGGAGKAIINTDKEMIVVTESAEDVEKLLEEITP